jgi:penicillin-binding protein 2
MVEVRNAELELHRLRVRLWCAGILVLALFGLLAGRLIWLQGIRHEQFSAQAENNRIAIVPLSPARGLIYDRHGVLLAENVSAYTLELSPRRIQSLETTIEALAALVDIGPRERRRFKRLLEDTKNAEWIPLKTRLTDSEVAIIAANRYRFEGVDIKARLFRNYPLGESLAHVVGYIGRISPDDKRRLEEGELESVYAGSTHLGKVGVEASYEPVLRGEPGFEEVEVSAGGRAIRSLARSSAVPGRNLVLSIDSQLQKHIEGWFGPRKGALVAIEPKTGQILALVSKPGFDPNVFIDGIDPQSWRDLNQNPDRPLLNRPLGGTYPPGSTYKPFMALAVLDSGVRNANTTIFDPGYFQLGGHRFRDSKPSGNGLVDLKKSIVVSSDTYYYGAALEMGVDRIYHFMKPWGFGQLTGIDLPRETTGILPSSEWKRKRYKQAWLPGETPSIGIGQGYNAFTILQLAHATATLAADGVVMRPHVVQRIEDPRQSQVTITPPQESHRITLRPAHLELVKQGMIEVNRVGTGRIAFAGAEYVAAGKTGTAQVIGIKQNEKYDARRIAERFRDHSLFMAFAPADQPRIALAVIVENGGFGAQAAAPIARKVFDYVLLGKLPGTVAPSRHAADDDEAALRDIPEPETPVTPPPASEQAPPLATESPAP